MNKADYMTPWTRLAALAAVGCITALAGCTEARLKKEAPQVLASLDDNLRIKGRFCTERSGEVTFPVKVLYLIDQSASLQCTDSGQNRFAALRKSVNTLRANPNNVFAFIGFSSWSRQVEFTRNRDDVAEFLDPNQGLGPATDYQGALATAIRVLESDMLDVGPAERARTRYQVVFVSDGVPEPRCNAGCEDDRTTCSDGIDNDGDGLIDAQDPDCANIEDNSLHPDNLYGVCNTSEEVPDDVYVDMTGRCPAYNQPGQIRRRIEELLSIKETYSVGGLVMNTVLLFSPQEVVNQVCPDASASFGYEKTQAESLLREMAMQGEGTFRDVNLNRENDDFLQFDITSHKAEQTLTSMMATNTNARRNADALEVDTDGDGLSDRMERELNSDPHKWDTDGDGYGDLFEYIHRAEKLLAQNVEALGLHYAASLFYLDIAESRRDIRLVGDAVGALERILSREGYDQVTLRDGFLARVDLAQEKLREVYAETALRHDIEAYEMAPIRKSGDAALEDLRQANGRVAEQLLVVDRSSRAWWKSYRGLLSQNKHPNMFFTNF